MIWTKRLDIHKILNSVIEMVDVYYIFFFLLDDEIVLKVLSRFHFNFITLILLFHSPSFKHLDNFVLLLDT